MARRAASGGKPSRRELGIDEFQVELGVVDDQPRVVADEVQKLRDDAGEHRMFRQELGRQAVHGLRFARHVALGIDVALERAAGRQVIDQLDAGDLDEAVAGVGIEAGRFGIENDLARRHKPPGRLCESTLSYRGADVYFYVLRRCFSWAASLGEARSTSLLNH